MNSRRAVVLAGVGMVVIGLIVVLTLRAVAPEHGATGPGQRASATRAADAAPMIETAEASRPAAASAAIEGPPPWARSNPGTEPEATTAASNADAVRARQLQKLRRSMQAIAADARERAATSNDRLRGMVETLEAMDDPVLTSRINLSALRDNLGTSDQMLAIAADIHRLYQQPKSAERTRQIKAMTLRMRQLQGQLRQDVRKPGAAAVPVAPTPTPTPAPAAAGNPGA